MAKAEVKNWQTTLEIPTETILSIKSQGIVLPDEDYYDVFTVVELSGGTQMLLEDKTRLILTKEFLLVQHLS